MPSRSWSDRLEDLLTNPFVILGTTAIAGAGYWCSARYHVCRPDQTLVRTGLGISELLVSKKGVQWPFQKAQFVSMNPRSYSFELHNMSREKVPFKLPVVFNIVPHDPRVNPELFQNYARTMIDLGPQEEENTVRSVVHGEMRLHTASMSIDEMFSDKERFKTVVWQKIQTDLDKFGLEILNANIADMDDLDKDSLYFTYRRKKAVETANNEAKVDVAEAQKNGAIGEQERKAQVRQVTAQLEAETVRVEQQQAQVRAEADKQLAVAEADFYRQKALARIEAEQAAQIREAELSKQAEAKRAEKELETARARDLVKAKVEAEATVASAQAAADSKRLAADAALYSEKTRAESIRAVLTAQSDGLAQLLTASGGNAAFAQFYLGLQSNLYTDLADKTANAIQGLAPKINVWNTGPSQGGDAFGFLKQLMSSVPPMLDVLKTQTDLPIPSSVIKSLKDY